ncbi:MAG: TIGR03619 family F420-dependent LLM class oxidoreductase [Pseudomonadota bacterium]
MKFWQSLAFVEMDQIVELAQFCESIGFHGVSYGDHLVTTKDQVDEYLYQKSGQVFWNPETHWPDPWVLTSALAQATTKLHFLSTIFILPMREPLSVAKALSTAALLSDNRITLGVGVGWQKSEFDMVGQDFSTRGKRADEMLTIIPKLMTGEMTEFHGKYYDIPPAKMAPGTTQAMPILVGGYAPAALHRAARHDGWMATSHEEVEIYPLIAQLNQAREQQGCADKPFEIWTGVKNPGDGTHDRLAAAGVTMVNGCNFLNDDGRTCLSSIDDKKRRIEQFASQFIPC